MADVRRRRHSDSEPPPLILPLENQVRELDAKLLLAFLAARRGRRSVIGLKSRIDSHLGRLRPGVYFAKTLTDRNEGVFRILKKLGHAIVAIDEEGLVRYPDEVYYARRVGLRALAHVDLLVAWGEADRQVLQACPGLPGTRIEVLGNPRVDLLRRELSGYFEQETRRLRREHGDFILVNTNFGSINCYDPKFNLFLEGADGQLVPGRGSRNMPADYALGLFRYRRGLLEAFRQLVPRLAEALPQNRIVLRPHPAENHARWRDDLAGHPNVHVIGEGSVIPWLRACRCLIHNGCTTAVEAQVLGTPAIAFVPEEDPRYEFTLPNRLSRRAGDSEVVKREVRAAGAEARSSDPGVAALMAASIGSLEGPLASERILEALDTLPLTHGTRPLLNGRLAGRVQAEGRRLKKRLNAFKAGDRGFAQHRFPSLSVGEVEHRLHRFSAVLGGEAEVRALGEDMFEIEAASAPAGASTRDSVVAE